MINPQKDGSDPDHRSGHRRVRRAHQVDKNDKVMDVARVVGPDEVDDGAGR